MLVFEELQLGFIRVGCSHASVVAVKVEHELFAAAGRRERADRGCRSAGACTPRGALLHLRAWEPPNVEWWRRRSARRLCHHQLAVVGPKASARHSGNVGCDNILFRTSERTSTSVSIIRESPEVKWVLFILGTKIWWIFSKNYHTVASLLLQFSHALAVAATLKG